MFGSFGFVWKLGAVLNGAVLAHSNQYSYNEGAQSNNEGNYSGCLFGLLV